LKTHCKYGHPLTEENRVQHSAALPRGRCKICRDAHAKEWQENHPEEIKTAKRKARKKALEKNPEIRFSEWLQYKHRMSLEDYQNRINAQGGRCAICKVLFDRTNYSTTPSIDHDHTCCDGERACGACNRGILCVSCNKGLGDFKDNVESLKAAVNYLLEHLSDKA